MFTLRRGASFAMAAVLAFAPLVARASGPLAASDVAASDVVFLKNGGLVRGVVIASEPGRDVVILVLGTGERRTIPWSEVERVQAGAVAPPAVAAPPPYEAPPPFLPVQSVAGPPPNGLGQPHVHFDADKPNVALYGGPYSEYRLRNMISQGTLQPVCVAPCDVTIDATGGRTFMFGGDGVPPSDGFPLDDRSGEVGMRVSTGNEGAHVAGTAMVGVGLVGTLVGLGVLIAGAAQGSRGHDLTTVGGVTTGASGGLFVLGVVLFGGPGKTSYSFVAAR